MEGAAVSLHKSLIDQEGEKMELNYRLLEGETEVEGQRVTTYGIEISEERRAGSAVPDISSDRDAVLALLETLWHLDVTPITLKDIVQDHIEN